MAETKRKARRSLDEKIAAQRDKITRAKEALKQQEAMLKDMEAQKRQQLLEKAEKVAAEKGITVDELLAQI